MGETQRIELHRVRPKENAHLRQLIQKLVVSSPTTRNRRKRKDRESILEKRMIIFNENYISTLPSLMSCFLPYITFVSFVF